MGNGSSNAKPPPMKIHYLHGKFLTISGDKLVATRHEGYADAMFFGSRVAERGEKMELIIKKMTKDWNGSLRFGFTSHNPVAICGHPEGIPRFMCPDLVKRGGSFIETLNHIKLLVGDRIVFWVTSAGEIKLSVNDVMQRNQVTKLVTQPVWPVVDVYGNAVEVRFCSLNDDPEELDEVKEPRYYSSLSLMDLPITGNINSIELISKLSLQRNDIRKAFVWNSSPLMINNVWILFVKEIDHNNAMNLSFEVVTKAVNTAPDTLQGLANRSSIFENVYKRNCAGDEMAICIINDGDIMVALNGSDFSSIGKVPKSEYYWLVADLNCGIKSLVSLGLFPLTKDSLPLLPNVKENSLPRERGAQSVPNNDFSMAVVESEQSSVSTPSVSTPKTTEAKCMNCGKSPNAVFIPCGHVCYCKPCADKGRQLNCPKCHKNVEKNIKVFF